MVSLQEALSPKERRTCPTNRSDDNSSSKKRKWEDVEESDHLKVGLAKELMLWKDDGATKLVIHPPTAAAIDLYLETPLPPEWQRCLDIQSGKIHFYNTRTHERTYRDPREIAADVEEPPPSTETRPAVSLDLQLNLTCESSHPRGGHGARGEGKVAEKARFAALSCDCNGRPAAAAATFYKTPSSWVSLDPEDPAGEMVATVCGRCHMLVMMCRSSPSCPSCKFSHRPDQMPSPAMLKLGAQALVL